MRQVSSLRHTRWECNYHIHMMISIPPKYAVASLFASSSRGTGLTLYQGGQEYEATRLEDGR